MGPQAEGTGRRVLLPERPHLAAAEVERRRKARLRVRTAIQVEHAATADADRLADELIVWADLLSFVWLTLTGHVYHRGEWRKPHG
jgi:hypothetical protein